MEKYPRALFLGFSCEEKYFQYFTGYDLVQQYAARKLEQRYLKGLRNLGMKIDTASLFPASTFPRNRKVIFGYLKNKNLPEEAAWTLPFVNIPFLKMLSRFSAAFACSIFWAVRNKKEDRIVILYSLHTPFLLSAFCLRILFGLKFFVIVTDFPEHMGRHHKFARFLKFLDGRIIQHLASHASGMSYVSKVASEFKPQWQGIPFVIIEGIVDDGVISSREDSGSLTKKIIFYSGGLSEDYGVRDLVDSIDFLTSDFEIWICGRGDLAGYVDEAAQNNSRIKSLGLLTPEQVKDFASKADMLINPRRLEKEFVALSFPSKLLEYLSYGVPVLTSRVPSIPGDYNDYLFYIEEVSARGIADSILRVFSLGSDMLASRAHEGQRYILKAKSPVSQCSRFMSLIRPS